MLGRKILLLLLLLLTVKPLLAAKLEFQNQTVLPLKFNTGNPAPYGLPSTVITIEDKVIPILFDTGAKKSEITLTPHALKNLNVKFTEKIICSNAFGGRHCEKEFIIPKVKLGNFVINNVKGTLMSHLWGGSDNDKYFKSTEASRNGIIGFALLSKFNLLLDYPNSKVVIVKPGNKPTQYNIQKWTPISFKGHLRTKLNLNGKLVTFTWDTGAIPSGISRVIARNFKQTSCPSNTPYKGHSDKCFRVKTHSLTTIHNSNLPNTWFSVADFPSSAPFEGIVGSNFYADNLVYFDFDNHKIYVKSVEN